MNEENNSFMNLDGVFVEGDYKESLRYYIDGKIYSLIS